MAEERENPDFGPEATAGAIDSAAMALAMTGASREKADAFLDDQRLHLHEQFRHLRKQIRLRLWEQRLGVMLRLATVAVGIAAAAGTALLFWDASHSSGLVVEPFAVPPDLAAKGLSGQVVAGQVLDKLTAMQEATDSSRASQTYENNWGANVKVEIPETGISVDEVYRFLRGWLGHDTHITGEVYRTAGGIAVTARAGGESGATFTGPDTALDALVQKAAEHVYADTQPYRYANYLDRNYNAADIADRTARSTAIYQKLLSDPNPLERAWAWNGLGTIEANVHADDRKAAWYYRKTIETKPDLVIGHFALAFREVPLSRLESALAEFRTAQRLLARDPVPDISPRYVEAQRLSADAQIAFLTGDFSRAYRSAKAGADLPYSLVSLGRGSFRQSVIRILAAQHDLAGVRSYLRDLGAPETRYGIGRSAIYYEREDWPAFLTWEAEVKKTMAQPGAGAGAGDGVGARYIYEYERPNFALAKAETGDMAGAETTIAPTAGDCDECLIARGRIADLKGEHARADWWFARAARNEPSIPFADAAWGQTLLARGDLDDAIAKFTSANQKGPHLADPLEMWGEALLAQKNPDAALEKFEEAEKYAPNWGRLHLKWGEALAAAGKSGEAKQQFALAAGLDLSPADKAELTKADGHG